MIRRRELLKALAASPVAGWFRGWSTLAQAIPSEIDALPHYRRAFARLAKLTDADRALIGGWKTVPLDEAVESLLRRFAPALDDLQRGASRFDCGWDEVVHLQDLGTGDYDIHNRRVGKIALLRARKHAESGRSLEALDDIFAAASFGRHFGRAGLLIYRIYQFSAENEAITALGAILPRLEVRALASVPTRVAGLPSPCSWAETMRLEGQFIASSITEKIEELPTPYGLEEMKDLLFSDEAQARAVLEATGGDRDRVWALAWEVVPYLAGLAEVLELPTASFRKALESFKARPDGINPIARSAVDQADHIRFAADRTGLLWTMLLAARTRLVDGVDRFRLIVDPFGDGPFTCVDFPGGFELRSALQREGKPPAIVRVGSP